MSYLAKLDKFEKAAETQMMNELTDNIMSTKNKIKKLSILLNEKKFSKPSIQLTNCLSEIQKYKKSLSSLLSEQLNFEENFKIEKEKYELKQKKIADNITELNILLNDLVLNNRNNKNIYENIDFLQQNKKNDDLQILNIDYQTILVNYQKAKTLLELKTSKQKEIKEILKMLKEEKILVSNKIIECTSQKESFEEMTNIQLSKFINAFFSDIDPNNNYINTQNSNKSLSNLNKMNLDIYSYEINNIEIPKLCNEIANQLMRSINIININKPQDQKNIFSSKTLINYISTKLQKIFFRFFEKKNYEFYISTLFEDFSNEITNFIINYFNDNKMISIKNTKTNEYLITFIKVMFKCFYLDNIIIKESSFINGEYKYAKKNYKNKLIFLNDEINKLTLKKEEYALKLNQLNCRKNYLIKINLNSRDNNFFAKEKKYMELNEQSDKLINSKKSIQNEIQKMENSYIILIGDIKTKIINTRKNLDILLKSKNHYEKEIENEKNKINDKIILLKNSMNEKIKMLKKIKNNSKNCLHDFSINNNSNKSQMINSNQKNSFIFDKNNNNNIIGTKKSNVNLNLSNKIQNKNLEISMNNFPNKYSSFYNINDSFTSKNNNNRLSKSINTFNNFDNQNNNYNTNIINNKSMNKCISVPRLRFNDKSLSTSLNLEKIESEYESDIFSTGIDKDSLWEEEKKKLLKTLNFVKKQIQTKKSKKKQKYDYNYANFNKINNRNNCISNNYNDNNNNNININKYNNFNKLKNTLKKLTHQYNCYFREVINDNKIKFNPLIHCNLINNEIFGYSKIYIKLFFDYNEYNIYLLIIDEIDNNIIVKINVNNIEATVINNNIKYIIKIHQKYKQMISEGNCLDVEEFVCSEELEGIPLDIENRLAAVNNNLYNFSLIVFDVEKESEKKYEFVIEGYENVKLWINSMNYIIKNKE